MELERYTHVSISEFDKTAMTKTINSVMANADINDYVGFKHIRPSLEATCTSWCEAKSDFQFQRLILEQNRYHFSKNLEKYSRFAGKGNHKTETC